MLYPIWMKNVKFSRIVINGDRNRWCLKYAYDKKMRVERRHFSRDFRLMQFNNCKCKRRIEISFFKIQRTTDEKRLWILRIVGRVKNADWFFLRIATFTYSRATKKRIRDIWIDEAKEKKKTNQEIQIA